MNAIDYSEYTLPLSTDPTCYGSDCTNADAVKITKTLARMAADQFPGLNVETKNLEGSFSVRGPDDFVCQEIFLWVQNNWTAAC